MLKTCWVVTEGKAGMELQGIALAEALSIPSISVKRVLLRFPWIYLSPYLRFGKCFSVSKKGDQLTPPYPDLIITVGRRSVIVGLLIKQKSPNSKLICVQNPYISPKHFDILVPSQHDNVKQAPNVVQAFGSLHRITSTKLAAAKDEFAEVFDKYTNPKIGVIIGGNSKSYTMDLDSVKNFMNQLKVLQKQYNASLLITASRRTPNDVLDYLASCKSENIFYWDNHNTEVPNPYLGILGSADALLVTCESVNMMSEACATDLPVYLLPLKGYSKRFEAFHKSLLERKRVEWFKGDIAFNKAQPVDAMAEVVIKIKQFLVKNTSKPN
jgi:mitochondrial fission protein ELM1